MIKNNDDYDRFISPNMEWRKFAWEQGVTIYASCIGGDNIALYKQKGEHFLRLNDVIYNQTNENEYISCFAEIDRGYQRFYEKNYDKNKEKKN
jgi:hypothetical protein